MSEDKHTKIDIPESIDAYRITLFWGLTIVQIILLFVATLFIGFGISAVVSRHIISAVPLFGMALMTLLGIVEIRGRNFYKHISFIISYYKDRPRVLVYHHYAPSGNARQQAKQLVYQQEDHSKTLVIIFTSLIIGVLLLALTFYYLYYVTHS